MTIDLTDEPINLPEQDKLGVKTIAETLATIIREMDARKGVAFGINGSWGSGKTSLIKLVEHYLQEDIREKNIKVVHFQCWWFNSEEALILNFLQTLFASLDEGLKKEAKEMFSAVLKSLAPLKPLAKVALNVTTGGAAEPLANMLNSIFDDKENKSMDALFQELSGQLAKSEKRYLVIIDDIDRLSAKEMTMMFRLVKTLGHLPNVVYLLGFDRTLAEQALSKAYPKAGDRFLEKIIQSFINIPLLKRKVVAEIVLGDVRDLLQDPAQLDPNSKKKWDAYYVIILICFTCIHTPRDRKRYKNALLTSYPAVKGKVHVPDYLVMEAWRIFEPELHAHIESMYPFLETPSTLSMLPHRESEVWGVFRNSCESKIRDERSDERKDAIQSIIHYLFSDTDGIKELAPGKRLASPEHFRTYFYWSAEAIPKR